MKSLNLAVFTIVIMIVSAGGRVWAAQDAKVEALRTALFERDFAKRACKIVSRGLKNEFKGQGKDVQDVIEKLLRALHDQDVAKIVSMFHSRVDIQPSAIQLTFKKIKLASPGPYNYSVFRVWALNTVDGTPDLLPCLEDNLAIAPHYGYDLQFGVWLQVMGSKELSRIYTSLVPVKGKWKLGSWHLQQWTHQERDPEAWVAEALTDAEKGDKLAAYIKLDLAAKLIDGGPYLYPKLKDDINATMASYFLTPNEWLAAIKNILPKYNVVYVGTLFAKDGAGFLIRTKEERETKAEKLRKDCIEIGNLLYRQIKQAKIGGIRCSYIVEGEDPLREGILGGRFLTRSEIQGK